MYSFFDLLKGTLCTEYTYVVEHQEMIVSKSQTMEDRVKIFSRTLSISFLTASDCVLMEAQFAGRPFSYLINSKMLLISKKRHASINIPVFMRHG